MKKRIKICLAVLIGLVVIPSLTFAQTTFRVDMDANTSGLQTIIDVTPGNTYTSSIELLLGSGSDSLSSFSYSLMWDNTEMSTPTNISTYAVSGWTDLSYLNQDSSHIYNFGQINLLSSTSGALGPVTLATFDWTATNPASDGLIDIMPGFYNASDSAFNASLASVSPTFEGGQINVAVVPEPISSALFIVGGATLGFRRFWRRKSV